MKWYSRRRLSCSKKMHGPTDGVLFKPNNADAPDRENSRRSYRRSGRLPSGCLIRGHVGYLN